ncbi:hypothetical protein SAMN05421812_114253 [Asanoa hainanensis]|uniref:Uncharacterized protein n=1 Tax=Asanoa hainanensis TaxID=560556 RepID=A0A239P7R9_9ACTN|nr:hypothetical protein [Asanoa hainanensis]SNT63012.1 hypothetical protein SAMN05421812_114253 [Asanoa hainanensis]
MDAEEIVAALAFVPEVRASVSGDRVTILVPALGDSVQLHAADVRGVRRIWAPDGAPALEFAVGDRPLIIVGTDVVFQPEEPQAVLDTRMRYVVGDMPHLVADTEMLRDAEAHGSRTGSGSVDYAALGAAFLLLRCVIVGAARFGLRPVAAVGWWDRGWRAVEDWAPLPPWRTDPWWDDLSAEAARLPELPSTLPAVRDERPDAAAVVVADFERLAPGLTVVGLDEQFVSAWRRWVPVAPGTFHATLTRGFVDANADVSLYPEGGGSIDLRVGRAFLQARFTYSDGELAIDEVRVPAGTGGGVFQRLMFNIEQVAVLLGMRRITLHATGIGAYAMARVGRYPRDPELYRRSRIADE